MLFRKVEVFESHKYWREVFESCFSHGLKIAVTEFLKINSDFVVDKAIDEKLLFLWRQVDTSSV